jgi:hypothetical protein
MKARIEEAWGLEDLTFLNRSEMGRGHAILAKNSPGSIFLNSSFRHLNWWPRDWQGSTNFFICSPGLVESK